jgi:Cys-rich protein (TIGR01571 family)
MIAGTREWSSGVCSCAEDWDTCCHGTFCSGCQLMEINATMEGRTTRTSDYCIGCLITVCSIYSIGAIVHGLINLKTREEFSLKYDIRDNNPCLKAFCCTCCSNCQMARELKQLPPAPSFSPVVTPPGMYMS